MQERNEMGPRANVKRTLISYTGSAPKLCSKELPQTSVSVNVPTNAHPSYDCPKTSYTLVWSEEEDKALTTFCLLHSSGDSWPAVKSPKIWDAASRFLQDVCGVKRTSKYYIQM